MYGKGHLMALFDQHKKLVDLSVETKFLGEIDVTFFLSDI